MVALSGFSTGDPETPSGIAGVDSVERIQEAGHSAKHPKRTGRSQRICRVVFLPPLKRRPLAKNNPFDSSLASSHRAHCKGCSIKSELHGTSQGALHSVLLLVPVPTVNILMCQVV